MNAIQIQITASLTLYGVDETITFSASSDEVRFRGKKVVLLSLGLPSIEHETPRVHYRLQVSLAGGVISIGQQR